MENGQATMDMPGLENAAEAKAARKRSDGGVRLDGDEARKLVNLIDEVAAFLEHRRFRGAEAERVPEMIERLQFRSFTLRNRLAGGS